MRSKPYTISCRLDEAKRNAFISKIKENGLSIQDKLEALIDEYLNNVE
jgi:hypothetical protein